MVIAMVHLPNRLCKARRNQRPRLAVWQAPRQFMQAHLDHHAGL